MSTTQNPRPFRVDVMHPNQKRTSYRFAVINGRASRFLKERHPIRLVTSPVEADLVDGGALTVYGTTLVALGLVDAPAPAAGPEFLAVHVPAPVGEEQMQLDTDPPAPVEQPSLFTESDPGEEVVGIGATPPAAEPQEQTVADCMDPAVVAAVEAPLETPEAGWTKTRVKKLRLDDLHRLAFQHGHELNAASPKAEAQAKVLEILGLN